MLQLAGILAFLAIVIFALLLLAIGLWAVIEVIRGNRTLATVAGAVIFGVLLAGFLIFAALDLGSGPDNSVIVAFMKNTATTIFSGNFPGANLFTGGD